MRRTPDLVEPGLPVVPEGPPVRPRRRRRFRALERLLGNRVAVIALGILVAAALVAVAAPWLAPYGPEKQVLVDRLEGPSAAHWLGTDGLGRDILSRLLFGLRVSIVAAMQAVGIAVVLGVPLGLLAGYMGRGFDAVVNGFTEAVMSMPPLILALAIVGIRGPGLTNAMVAIGIILAPRFFKVARGAAHSIREETYIEGAQVVGCSTVRIMWRHLLPNASGPLLVQISFAVGLAIVAEASLSFLGLGVQDPTSSLGSMTRDAFLVIRQHTFAIWPPAVAIAVVVLAFSLLGDAVRDALGRESVGGRS